MRIKFNLKSFLLKIFLIIGLIGVDLIAKELFSKFLSDDKKVNIITNIFSLQYTENTGAAYGIFSNNTIMLIIVSCLFLVGLIVYDLLNSSNNIWYNLGISFIIGGAIGNLIDRIFLGYVRDFANFEILRGLLLSVEETGSPMILQISESAMNYFTDDILSKAS